MGSHYWGRLLGIILFTLLVSACANPHRAPAPVVDLSSPAPSVTVENCDADYGQRVVQAGKDLITPSCLDDAENYWFWTAACAAELSPLKRAWRAIRFGAEVTTSAYDNFAQAC